MARSLSTLLAGETARVTGGDPGPIEGLTADSREVKPGFVFAALPGTAMDGARFIPQAIAKGAAAILCRTGTAPEGVPVIETDNPRRLFAKMAGRFHGRQPDLVAAVTGTNGKTSVASFVRQIWTALGFRAASLGTVGLVAPWGEETIRHTTPDPMTLHEIAARLSDEHVDHLAIEASSHGLAQYRLDGLRISAGAFTNISRDHLDYHKSFEEYFDAKMRLFSELLPQGGAAVINADSPQAAQVQKRAKAAGLSLFTTGVKGRGLKLLGAERDGLGQRLSVRGPSRTHELFLPLAGDFQVSNALVAAGLVIATGGEETLAMHALESFKGASGRLELVGRTADAAPVFVDYSHTPDALETALKALRPYAEGRLMVVFGAGGDRDRGKRPLMGAACAAHADIAIVTDDNPRSEDPAQIRRDVLAGCPGAREIGDRALAIRAAVEELRAGDALLVAGKGHESGQEAGGVVKPFRDHDAVRAALRGEDYHG